MVLKFIKHWLFAQNKHDVHSPFVFELITRVIPHQLSDKGKRINDIRSKLASSNEKVEIRDFGAGYNGKRQKTITKQPKPLN